MGAQLKMGKNLEGELRPRGKGEVVDREEHQQVIRCGRRQTNLFLVSRQGVIRG